MDEALKLFSKETVAWFERAVGKPTQVQRESWPAIASGGHALVSAPTGTGKTLSAFLWFVDELAREAEAGELPDELRVVYISPLKALGNDINENLKRPIEGITGATCIRTAVRTGDTPQSERTRMQRKPPHILITTPESLYLLLTSSGGRRMLSTARAVIVDELHAIIGTKRGAHLMLSLSRMDELCRRPLQRVGLSATIHPLQTAADYLAEGTRVIAPAMQKAADMEVVCPVPDMRVLPEGTIWPELARAVVQECEGMRTVIAFLEGRAQAEKLAYGVNALMGEGFARTHHGCISKEQRLEAEQQLRSGQLRLLCATSSMELGIDVGEVDKVVQIGCPGTVSGALQRLGRAGHNPGRVSVMRLFPRTAAEALTCGLTATAAMRGSIEPARPPQGCLDVLAQHLVSMAVTQTYTVDEALRMAHGAHSFRSVTRAQVEALLCMLAGDFEHELDRPVRPRLLYDRIHGVVSGDTYTRMLAVSSGGTIPDRGWFPVVLADGTRLGELDEEYVFEARVGDKFLLGAFSWRVAEIQRDRVIVTPATPEGAQSPFWRGDGQGRAYETGVRFGEMLRTLEEDSRQGQLEQAMMRLRMDASTAQNASRHVKRQLEVTGCLPTDRTLIAEHFVDEAGEHQLMIHSVFGRRVNYALSLLLAHEAQRQTGVDVRAFEDDDGVLLYLMGSKALPEGLLFRLKEEEAPSLLRAILPGTPLFSMAFRYNAGRALMMGVRRTGRLPLWVQRLRGAEALSGAVSQAGHPLIEETLRECLEDFIDLPALRRVLQGIQAGGIAVRELHTSAPSPMALPLRRQVEATMMYEYSPIPKAANQAVQQALTAQEMIAPGEEALRRAAMRRRQPQDAEQLHALLMTEGDLVAGEADAPVGWLEQLAQEERALYVEPGLWICAEQRALYEAAFLQEERQARERIVRRCLRYRGPQDAKSLSMRYVWPEDVCEALLKALLRDGIAAVLDGLYYHADVYERAQRETVQARRVQAVTYPPERYAALLAAAIRTPGSSADQLREGLLGLTDSPYPVRTWESVLLPARTSGYRARLLDAALSQGEVFWQIQPGEKPVLSFHAAGDVDWSAEPELPEDLTGAERTAYEILRTRGALFAQAVAPQLGGESALDALTSLALKGYVHADSFAPLREWQTAQGSKRRDVKRRAMARASAQQAGRWEVVRPLRTLTLEERLERAFSKAQILCRETAEGLSWGEALSVLRIWEYTGKVRRGYYIRGLSGAQFIREEDYARVLARLDAPQEEIVWLNAADPAQAWGKALPHAPGASFTCVPGTAVALRAGRVAARLARRGASLRIVLPDDAEEVLQALARDFAQRRVFSDQQNLCVRDYPDEVRETLVRAGFRREMRDYVLWREI